MAAGSAVLAISGCGRGGVRGAPGEAVDAHRRLDVADVLDLAETVASPERGGLRPALHQGEHRPFASRRGLGEDELLGAREQHARVPAAALAGSRDDVPAADHRHRLPLGDQRNVVAGQRGKHPVARKPRHREPPRPRHLPDRERLLRLELGGGELGAQQSVDGVQARPVADPLGGDHRVLGPRLGNCPDHGAGRRRTRARPRPSGVRPASRPPAAMDAAS
ncbi:hypothetical protein [Nonomuraea salmonea]|uniref:hypothetical protein n=1 Tax=Nonomuraea salmonea TaxID=46181 RepID=UPI0031EAC740